MELLYTAHVPAGDGPFPTIFLLHGWGASAHDLIGLAPILHGGARSCCVRKGRSRSSRART
jgi:predicted esterase